MREGEVALVMITSFYMRMASSDTHWLSPKDREQQSTRHLPRSAETVAVGSYVVIITKAHLSEHGVCSVAFSKLYDQATRNIQKREGAGTPLFTCGSALPGPGFAISIILPILW